MMTRLPLLLLSLACALGSCQRTETTPDTAATPNPTTATAAVSATSVGTATAARTVVQSYVQALPNHALYQVDSASIVESDAQFQVLVPRIDWAGRMPNKAAFNVDKQTGTVTEQPVK